MKGASESSRAGRGAGPSLWPLGLRHARFHALRTVLLAAFLGLAAAVPVSARAVIAQHERSLRARAEATPVVIGARTSRFDLAFNALTFRRVPAEPVAYRVFAEMLGRPGVRAVPLHARHTARGAAVVGTDPEYARLRGLVAASGRWPAILGEAAVGARAAERLSVTPGSVLASDPTELYDITAPPAIELSVVGVLGATGTPDDDAVFVSLQTAWLLDGLIHGHREAAGVTDPSQLVARGASHVALSGSVVELSRVTPESLSSFHPHAEPGQLPLTAVIAVPDSDKSRTMLLASVNAASGGGEGVQALEPKGVIDELMLVVLRIRSVLDALSALLGAGALAAAGLVLLLAWKIRATEIRTLRELGCSPGGLAQVVLAEVAVIVVIAAGIAAGVVALAVRAGPWIAGHLAA